MIRIARTTKEFVGMLLLALAMPGYAEIRINPGDIHATSKEIAFSYTAPENYTSSQSCTVKASRKRNFAAGYEPVIDVDPVKFPGSHEDTRHAPLIDYRFRTFVLGKEVSQRAADGFVYSRALKAATAYFIQLTCGADTVEFDATTATVPFGLTRGEALPADPDNPGEYLHPSRKWNISGQKVVDPETGVELTFPEAAGTRGVTSSTLPFKDSIGTAWTNPANTLADDAASATISGSLAPLFLKWNQDTAPITTSTTFGSYDTSGLDYFLVTLKGSGAAASTEDRKVEVALTFDGVTPGGQWNEVTLPTTEGTVTVGSATPGQTLQTAGRPPVSKNNTLRKSGTMTYVAATKVATFATGSSSTLWSAGTKIRVLEPTVLISNVTAGTPPTVTTLTAHGYTTGQQVTLTGVTGTIASSVNGPWIVTVTSATTFTLDGGTATGTYGVSNYICQKAGGLPGGTIRTVPGTPPQVYMPNSNWYPVPVNARLNGFTSAGWTGLNGNVYEMNWVGGDSELYTIGGATTTGAYGQTNGDDPDCTTANLYATATRLSGTAQAYADYSIATVDSATQVTLTTGPASDITTATSWTVDGFGVLVRKKTTSADTISVNYASATYSTSSGTAWGASGGPVCAKGTVSGPGGVPGRLCNLGTVNTFISTDGTISNFWGQVYHYEELTATSQGKTWITGGNSDSAKAGVNPNYPNRIYSWIFDGAGNKDRNLWLADYVGDYRALDPTKGPNSLYANYAGYPVIPNCNGYAGIEGVNPPVSLPPGTPCLKYRQLMPSLHAAVTNFGQQRWREGWSSPSDINCASQTNLVYVGYNEARGKVHVSVACGDGQDVPGIIYVVEVDDATNTASLFAEVTTFDRDNVAWSSIHGRGGTDGQTVTWFPHPIALDITGAINLYKAVDMGDTRTLKGPWKFTYTSVDGVDGADLGTTLGSCAAWSGSPYIASPAPDGTTIINGFATGCTTIVVDGEPYDTSLGTAETNILTANAATHLAKTGASGRKWLRDLRVGDAVIHYNPGDNNVRKAEYMVVISKTGSGPGATLVLYRGGGVLPQWWEVYEGTIGAQNHAGQGKTLLMWLSYNHFITNGGLGTYPNMHVDYIDNPTGTGGGARTELTGGHGASNNRFGVGTQAGKYGVFTGGPVARRSKLTTDYFVENLVTFAGRGGNDISAVETHATAVDGAGPPNSNYDYILDGRPWNGYNGVNGTLISGTTSVYKWSQATWDASILTKLHPKHLPMAGRAHSRVMRSISGPGSLITDATPYRLCYALVAGECRADSAAGDFYMSAPNATLPGSVYQCCGNDASGSMDMAFTSATSILSRYTQTLLAPDLTGNKTRALTSAFDQYRVEDSFKNWSITPDGKMGIGRTRALENVKSEVFTVEMPPIQPDSWDRSKYILSPIAVPPYRGANHAVVEFGYARYGNPAANQYFCMDRLENCVAGLGATDVDPFKFASEPVTGVPCINGCSVDVPVVGNRILYYQIKYLKGTIPVYTTPQRVLATP